MTAKKDIWNNITNNLKSNISRLEFNIWISNTTLKDLGPDLALIEVPNRFVASWLRDNYLTQIRDSFKSNLNLLPKIRFTYTSPQHTNATPKEQARIDSDANITHHLDPGLTFATFVTASSNRLAYSAAINVAKKSPTDYNPLYIFSDLSLGKSHLLNAIGNRLIAANPFVKVKYLSADRFSSDFLTAIRERNLVNLRKDYGNLDFLLLDDIHLLVASEKSQQELISLFNSFYQSKKQMVMAGPRPPNQIEKLIPSLKSRLEWGLLSEIKIPDQKTKMKIIWQKAKERNLDIPEDVAFFLAKNSGDLKGLTTRLFSLEKYGSLYQRKINMSTLNSIINRRRSNKITVSEINKLTVEYFNISLSDLLSNQKKRRFSYPRQLAIYLTRQLTTLSTKEIGHLFGNRDHSTVLYTLRRIENQIDDPRTSTLDDIRELQNLLF